MIPRCRNACMPLSCLSVLHTMDSTPAIRDIALFPDLIAQQEGETPSEELLELGAKVRYRV